MSSLENTVLATGTAGPSFFNAKRLLNLSAQGWFIVAAIGQFIFTAYIIGLYGVSAYEGDFERWSAAMPHGHVPGDTIGNLSMAMHLLFAALVNVGGPLQLIPQVRKRLPGFHRILGRIYVGAGFLISLSGLYLIWVRGSVGGTEGAVSTSLNALLIMAFAILSIQNARKRKFAQHRKWTLRLFLAMSGVWFFRVGLMLWLFIHQAPVGFDPDTFRGPFLVFLGFGQYLIPLAILELYFWAQKQKTPSGKYTVAALIGLAMIGTAVGVFAVTVGMWLPRV